MEFDLAKAVSVLQATPAVLRAWLGQLPAEWILSNDGPDSWSPFDVVGHLIHGERSDWIPRAKIILSGAQRREFEPFDRFAMLTENQARSVQDLLNEFEALRQRSLIRLAALRIRETDFGKTGVHPTLGEVTLRQLLSTWVAHDLNHLGQIAEVLARQYKAEVGPWKELLAILGP